MIAELREHVRSFYGNLHLHKADAGVLQDAATVITADFMKSTYGVYEGNPLDAARFAAIDLLGTEISFDMLLHFHGDDAVLPTPVPPTLRDKISACLLSCLLCVH